MNQKHQTMLKRTLLFSNPYHLSTTSNQLVVNTKGNGTSRTVPIEDLGFVVLEHPQITFTQSAMQLLSENNTAVVFCNNKYLPVSMLLNLNANTVQTETFRYQLNASEPLKKQIWQQTIKAKIRNQAAALDLANFSKVENFGKVGLGNEALLHIAKNVKSGDVTNREGEAARRYWPLFFGRDFARERFGESPNPALNYGYAIIRAATARALSGSGLLPILGIHHRNKYNAYCLADDIMEPYRPIVDLQVKDMLENEMDCEDLKQDSKACLLELLSADVQMGKNKRPLMVALSETTASLAKVFKGESKKMKYPQL
ncbi:MAG: type II CRISPR-associated endonuclease Cas1 [Chitinophagales bacterium]